MRHRTLFSRMISTYLAVTLGLLILLGIMLSQMFRGQYISEKEAELRREAAEIIEIVTGKYLDEEKRPVAREELATIARKYDALIQLYFADESLGYVYVTNSQSPEKWAACESVDISEAAEYIVANGSATKISTGMFKNVASFSVMTLTVALRDAGGNVIGALLFHADMSATNSAITQVLLDVLLSGLIAVVLAVFAVSYITGRITRPVVQMGDAVRRFSSGDYNARVDIVSDDEIGELAVTFNEMADEINTLEQARRSFVANVSHELRSPLTSMKGFLEAMVDGTIPAQDHEKYLTVVIDENKRMISMVNGLLDLAKIEAGEGCVEKKCFDVNELIRRTLITFEARIVEKRIEIGIEFASDRCSVLADPVQISQVLRNLIDNAIKFSPVGGTIVLRSSCDKKYAYISVCDNGRGISEDDTKHIFDRFFKAEKARTPSGAAGTGLGLAIVKRIVDSHGETITVKSKLGEGTMFTFTLQLAKSKYKVTK